jgi:electron transfer flavoprotein alpha subunit
METILLLTHSEADGSLPRAALEALSAAQSLGGPVTAAVFGGNVDAAAKALAATGVAKVLTASGDAFAQPRYATDSAAAAALAKAAGAQIVIAPATSRMARVAAGLAQRLGGKIDTHVTQLVNDGGLAISRWYYKQRIEATQRRKERPWVLLVDPGAYPAAPAAGGSGTIEKVEVAAPASRTTVVGVKAPTSGEQTIKPDAKLLFVAGAGWTKKQADGKPNPEKAEKLILGFIRASGASLGSSKSLVDQAGEGQKVFEFMTHLNQVGQTGSTPRHPKGLAACCHGEEPHVVGWRFIRERRAINIDPACGWARGKADVLYVADAFVVMEKVNALLGAR